jgi:prophage antirepressor-like protein
VKFSVWCDTVIEDILKGAAEVTITKPHESAVLALPTFTFSPAGPSGASLSLRVVDREGEPWFVAKDVCEALGYPEKSRGQIVSKLDADEKALQRIQTSGHALTLVSESGLYTLVMRSDKPQAHAFQKWVTSVVLPAIRKDGAYVLGEEKVVVEKTHGLNTSLAPLPLCWETIGRRTLSARTVYIRYRPSTGGPLPGVGRVPLRPPRGGTAWVLSTLVWGSRYRGGVV